MTMPMAIQTTKRIQVSAVRFNISRTQATIAAIGSAGTNGIRNARCRSGRVRRRMITPAETKTKANSVPTLTISSSLVIGNSAAAAATTTRRARSAAPACRAPL